MSYFSEEKISRGSVTEAGEHPDKLTHMFNENLEIHVGLSLADELCD